MYSKDVIPVLFLPSSSSDLFKVKLKDFNYSHFERCHDYMDYETTLATRTKNDIYKFLKSILNYATAWYEFSFVKVYPKMTNFNNPNELPPEQLCFTYDEFKQFIEVEEDIKWQATFRILYYCSLRKGELRGLQWKDVDLERKTLSVRKQIADRCGTVKKFKICGAKNQK